MFIDKINYRVYSNKPFAIWTDSKIIDERLSANSYNQDYLNFRKGKSTFNLKKISGIAKVTAMIGWKGLTTDNYVNEDGVYLLRTVDIKDNFINLENAVMAEREKVYEQPQIILKQGDIIFSKDGTLGVTAIVPRHQNKEMCVGSTLARIRLNSKLDNYYVCAAFMSRIVQAQIRYFVSGITQPHITQEYINKLEIPIPSPEIQKYIGDKVRKAEELREEAKRLKKEAEEIINDSLNFRQLDLLYKGSKVKFKWISTNVLTDRTDGNYYEQKYVETINHIKRNSKKCITLNSIIDSIYTGKKPMYDEKGTEAYFVESGNISSNFLEIDNKEKVDLSKYNQVLFGDLLIAKDGETIGKIAINLINEIIIINEHTYCVRLKEKYKYYSAYIYYLLINDYINPLIRREATGSAQKGLNFSFAENIIIPILEEDIIINLYNLELRRCNNIYKSKQLVQEAKQDVEDLIEGNFEMSKEKAKN